MQGVRYIKREPIPDNSGGSTGRGREILQEHGRLEKPKKTRAKTRYSPINLY